MVRRRAAYPNVGGSPITYAQTAFYSEPRGRAADGNDAGDYCDWPVVTARPVGKLLSLTGFAAGVLWSCSWHSNRLLFAYDANETFLYSALRLAVKPGPPTEATVDIVIDKARPFPAGSIVHSEALLRVVPSAKIKHTFDPERIPKGDLSNNMQY